MSEPSQTVTIHPDQIKITTGRADGSSTLHLVVGEYELGRALDAVGVAQSNKVEVTIKVTGAKEE